MSKFVTIIQYICVMISSKSFVMMQVLPFINYMVCTRTYIHTYVYSSGWVKVGSTVLVTSCI